MVAVAIISNDSMSDYTKMPFSQVTNYIIQNLTVGRMIIFLVIRYSSSKDFRILRFYSLEMNVIKNITAFK